jgi:Holliday junction resolvase-like predicted endonuclease
MSDEKCKGKIGEVVEYKAVAWLLLQGLEVYKNVTYHGPIDIITLDLTDGVIRKVDVKKVVDGSRRSTKVSHPAKKPLQEELGVVFLYYDEKQDFFAWSTEEIYKNMGKQKLQRVIQPCITFDRQFPSITAAAKHFGVKERTVLEWMRRNPTETVESAIQYAQQNTKAVCVDGIKYSSKKEACEAIGVSLRVVEYWHYEKHKSFEEAVHEVQRRGK